MKSWLSICRIDDKVKIAQRKMAKHFSLKRAPVQLLKFAREILNRQNSQVDVMSLIAFIFNSVSFVDRNWNQFNLISCS